MKSVKKIIGVLMILSTVLAMFASCKGSNKNYKSYIKENLIIWGDPTYNQSMYEAVKEFNKSYPNVTVKFVKKKSSEVIKDFGKIKDQKEFPNIICLDDNRLREFTFKYYRDVLNLNDKFNSYMDKFLKYKKNIVNINNNILAVPYSVKPVALYYRKDVFEKYNINPLDIKTWNDFINVGKTILNKSDNKTKMLYVNSDEDMFKILLNEKESSYFNKEGMLSINDINSKKSMEIIKNMYNFKIIQTGGYFDFNKNQNIATVIGDISVADYIKKSKEKNNNWGVMRLPAFENGGKNSATLGGTSLVIIDSEDSKNDNDLSVKLAKYITLNKKNLKTSFEKYSVFPSYTPAYDCSNFSKSIEAFDNLKLWKFFEQISKDIPIVNYTENFNQIDKIVATFIKEVVNSNDIDVKLKHMKEIIEKVVN